MMIVTPHSKSDVESDEEYDDEEERNGKGDLARLGHNEGGDDGEQDGEAEGEQQHQQDPREEGGRGG